MKFPITFRQNNAAKHESMDVETEYADIFRQIILHEFPIEVLLAAEISQLVSFTFPNGTRLLHATGEFEKNSLKRLDDTRAILYEMGADTFESERAETMANHLNSIHGQYNIPNDEFLHTLSTFIYELSDFIDRFGWRKLTPNEKQAIYLTYVDMGNLMKIDDIPPSFETFQAWKLAYEAEHQAFSENNHLVAEGLMKGIKEMVPAVFGPFVLPFVLSLRDERFAQLLGYRYPNVLTRGFFRSVMWLRQQWNRLFTIWDVLDFEQAFFTTFKTYPNGYNPLKLGPAKIIRRLEKQKQAETECRKS